MAFSYTRLYIELYIPTPLNRYKWPAFSNYAHKLKPNGKSQCTSSGTTFFLEYARGLRIIALREENYKRFSRAPQRNLKNRKTRSDEGTTS
jgi:hypothetical protein